MWRELLQDSDIDLDEAAVAKLGRFESLIREWNPVVSLVSRGDLDQLEARHTVDCISLAPYVLEACRGKSEGLLDIGSGAGFPAIPLKVALPWLKVTMIERSERKVGFLRKVVAALGLEDATIVCGDFPRTGADIEACAVTARAVERPEKVVPQILKRLRPGTVYLCQSGDACLKGGEMFHVEPVDDAWTRAGLRRGTLHRVTRRPAMPE